MAGRTKKVSICIPAYKQWLSLKRCLDSIALQTFTDYEIIISDDSPTSEIEELVKQYDQFPIHYHRNEIPLGSPENWNKAMSLAQGKYIQIMHHDDWFSSSSSLGKFVEALDKNATADFAFCACTDIGENLQIKRRPNRMELHFLKKNPDILAKGNLIGHPSASMFRNQPDIYFDNHLIWLVDIEFYIRILRNNPDFIFIPEYLVNIGISPEQITRKCENNKELIENESKFVENKLHPEYGWMFWVYHNIKNKLIPYIKRIYRKR